MTTKHFAYTDGAVKEIISSAIQHCDDIVKKHGIYLRLVKQGAGLAILPDTNRTEDIGEKEFAKAFHLGEILTTTALKSPERITTIFTYDDSDTMFVSLTADQLRLLEWLQYNDCLCEGMNYISIGSEKFEEI